jgi:hypothetical protein
MATWRRCSSCKTEIPTESTYWLCSVSTCTRPRTGFFFCSVACWEAHLPTMRHRESWAVEKRAPTQAEWEREQELEDQADEERSVAAPPTEAPRRRVVPASPAADEDDLQQDILIVASKLKKYIRARSGMNTSDGVMTVLSDIVRRLCDQAIRKAGEETRKTVLDRDFRGL